MEIPGECEVNAGSTPGGFSETGESLEGIPSNPPPSYEHVLKEVRTFVVRFRFEKWRLLKF